PSPLRKLNAIRECPFFSVVAWGGFSTVRNEGLSEKHIERQMDSQAGRRALPSAAARPVKSVRRGRNPDSLPPVNPPGDGGLKPRRAFGLRRREGGPLLADEVEVDLVAIGGQQGLDVDLVLGPEGDHLGEDQPLGSSHADSVALR